MRSRPKILMPAALIPLLVALPFLVFSGAFHAGFEIPKLLALYVLGGACLALFATRRDMLLPPRSAQWFLLAYAGLTLLSGLWSPVVTEVVTALAMFASLIAVYLVILNTDDATRSRLLLMFLALSVIEALIGFAQAMQLDAWLPGYLLYGRRPVVGTLGNEEFLGTLLGVGFFIAVHLYRQPPVVRWQRLLCLFAIAVTLAGLALTHNKGGLLFIALTFVWRWRSQAGLAAGIAILGVAALVFLFPAEAKGRALLWLASVVIFAAHPLIGVGPGQFENAYLDAVHALFTNYPLLAEHFAANAAGVRDAHNVILNQAAELGAGGLALAIVFVVYVWRIARRRGDALGLALGWILFKSLYTVVLGTATSALLLAILIALTTRRETLVPMRPARPYGAAIALAALAAVFATWVSWSDLYYQRGLRALMSGQLPAAQAQFENALRHYPQNGEAWLGLAQVHYQRHDPVSMETALQRAIAVKNEINVVKIAAHIYFYSGHYDQAEALYEILHVVYPGHLTTTTRLALIAAHRANYTQARQLAQAVLNARPPREVWSDGRNRAIARQLLQQIDTNNHWEGNAHE
jgi:O-antigen ligase